MRPVKPFKMIHPSHARCVLTEQEAARLRQAGWLEFDSGRSVSKGAALQRQYRQHRKELGMRQLVVWLPEETFTCLVLAKRPDESMADLLVRLARLISVI